jgi:MFS family permease
VRTLAIYRRLLSNRPLAKLLGGEFVSTTGDWLYVVALLVVIYRETGDPLWVGVFGAAQALPFIVLSIPAGMLADRFDRRLILLVSDLARGACMLAMAAVVATGGPTWLLVVLAIIATSFSTVFFPCIGAYIPSLVRDERELGAANSAWGSLDNLGYVVGPVLGGLLVVGGATFAFLVNAATFAVIAVILWRLPASGPSRVHVAVDGAAAPAPEGRAATTATPGARGSDRSHVRAFIGIAVIRSLDYAVSGGLWVMTVILATEVLHGGAPETGYLNAAIGIGGVVGAVASGALVLRRGLGRPLLIGAIALAIGTAALGVSTWLIAAMAAFAVVSGGHMVIEVIGTTLVQRITPDRLLGRSVGVMTTVDSVADAVGAFLMPVLAIAFGIEIVLGVSAALVLVAAVAGMVLIGPALVRPVSALEATLARVAKLPLFAGASAWSLERALGQLEVVDVPEGAVVIAEGDTPDRFYIIDSGSMVVTQALAPGGVRELRRLGPDDVFGELGLLRGTPRTATVTAAEASVLLALDGPEFLALIGGTPTLRARLQDRYEPAAGPA